VILVSLAVFNIFSIAVCVRTGFDIRRLRLY
jgi:hypothetical protein